MKDKIVTVILSIIIFVVPMAFIPYVRCQYTIPRLVLLLVCGFILLITLLIRIDEIKVDKQDIFIFIFGLLAIISTVFSVNVKKSFIGEWDRYEGLLTILTYILIYYNAKYYFKEYDKYIYLGSVIYILICIYAMVQYSVGYSMKIPPFFGKGAVTTFGNTNFTGSFISLILPAFTLGYIFRNRKIYFVGSVVAFCTMVMCLTRSSWVAFGMIMLLMTIYFIKNKKKNYLKRFFIIIAAFVISFVGIISLDKSNLVIKKIDIMSSEIEEFTTSGIQEKMGSSRIRIWKLTSNILYKAPIFGCGVDALFSGLQKLCPIENNEYIQKTRTHVDKAHNEYLQIATTMGIPALIVYLIFIGMIVIGGIKKSLKYRIVAMYTIIIISYLTQAFFNISTIGIAPLFWFILGIASRNINRNKKELQV